MRMLKKYKQTLFFSMIVFTVCFFAGNALGADHGDTMATAETLTSGTALSQNGASEWDDSYWDGDWTRDRDEGDWYVFVLPSDQSVEFTFTRSSGIMKMYLRDGSGGFMRSFSGYDWWGYPNTIKVDPVYLTAGTYYIQIINQKIDYWWSTYYPEFTVKVDFSPSSLTTYYADNDGDGYGNPDETMQAATQPLGFVTDSTDCADNATELITNPGAVHPGATEICDYIDNDCDNDVDEGMAPGDYKTYYLDNDGDGYGLAGTDYQGCASMPPAHYSAVTGDCDDNNADKNPGEFDICEDGIDQNCDGSDRICASDDSICADLANFPVETQVSAAKPIIMLLLDDSGSMDFDVVCPETGGEFDGHENVNDVETAWRSQWFGYNGIYYNPGVTYEPWVGLSYPDADINNPKAHPNNQDWWWNYYDGTQTYSMDSEFEKIDGVSIKRSHYYVWSAANNAPYLVNLVNSSGTYQAYYYKVTGTWGTQQYVTNFSSAATPPADVAITRTPQEERQNFANWFTYHRTRERVAKAALGKVVNNLTGAMVGIHTINHSKILAATDIDTNKATILTNLYYVGADGGTPLRTGLQDVGQYLHANDFNTGNIGSAPWASDADGGSCQKAFVIMMTDGYYNGSSPGVGNVDGNNNSPYADTYSDTLADVAMYYYENDLNSSLDNNVTTGDQDSASHQHMVTYSISFGMQGTVDPESYPDCIGEGEAGSCPSWPEPNTDPRKIDDLWHASVNGRGDYFKATNALELVSSLEEILANVGQREGQGASVAVNTQTLEEGTAMFQGVYNSADWSGDLRKYVINTDGSVAPSAAWSARAQLDLRLTNSGHADRDIFTYDPATSSTVAFTDTGLTSTLKNLLSTDATTATNLVNYLRGDTSNDKAHGGGFRTRPSLGDIVHSAPVHYGDYLYVGANDGMLHAFKAGDGKELFAFIPRTVFKNLNSLASTDYDHRYYVDNTTYVNTITINGVAKTLLVGSLGKGGKGVYAIDITDPDTISESNLPDVWEYSTEITTDNDLGYTFSQVFLEKSNDATYPYVIIFGNGYDSVNGKAVLYVIRVQSDGSRSVQKIDTGYGDPVPANNNCNGLSTPSLVDTDYNGTVDLVYAGDLRGNMWKFDLSSTSAADWKVAYTDGTSAQPLFQAKDSGGNPQPITTRPAIMHHCYSENKGYMVVFGTGKYISLSDHSSSSQNTLYGIWDWQDEWDANSAAMVSGTAPENTSLGYLMAPVAGIRKVSGFQPADLTVSLLEQTASTVGANGTYRTISSEVVNWFSPAAWLKTQSGSSNYEAGYDAAAYTADGYGGHVGWFMDLPDSGERVIAKPIVRTGSEGESRAIIVSLVPISSACSAGGYSILHIISACSGGTLENPQFDTDNDNDVDDDDNGSGGMLLDDIYYEPVVIQDEDTGIDHLYFTPDEHQSTAGEALGMLYWWVW